MKFCALVLELHLPQNFCHRHADKHFPEIVKSCSGQPKTCKSFKNQKSKICTKPMLPFIYIEESNNIKVNKVKLQEIKFRYENNAENKISFYYNIGQEKVVGLLHQFFFYHSCKNYKKYDSSEILFISQ